MVRVGPTTAAAEGEPLRRTLPAPPAGGEEESVAGSGMDAQRSLGRADGVHAPIDSATLGTHRYT